VEKKRITVGVRGPGGEESIETKKITLGEKQAVLEMERKIGRPHT